MRESLQVALEYVDVQGQDLLANDLGGCRGDAAQADVLVEADVAGIVRREALARVARLGQAVQGVAHEARADVAALGGGIDDQQLELADLVG